MVVFSPLWVKRLLTCHPCHPHVILVQAYSLPNGLFLSLYTTCAYHSLWQTTIAYIEACKSVVAHVWLAFLSSISANDNVATIFYVGSTKSIQILGVVMSDIWAIKIYQHEVIKSQVGYHHEGGFKSAWHVIKYAWHQWNMVCCWHVVHFGSHLACAVGALKSTQIS